MKKLLSILALTSSLVASANDGINMSASYTSDLHGCISGGLAKGFANAGSLDLSVTADLARLYQIRNSQFFASGVFRSGNNLSSKKIGNDFQVAQAYGSETYRLNEAYFKHRSGSLNIKVGRLNCGNDFLTSPLYQSFVSGALCGNPIGIFFNSKFSAYPYATWGVYADYELTPTFTIKLGGYNNHIDSLKNCHHGVDFTFNHPEGRFFITETILKANQLPRDAGFPGAYTLGYYYSTEKISQFDDHSHKGNYGYYLLIDQMIYQTRQVSISPFAALLFAPQNRNQFPFYISGGVVCKGVIPGRKDDSLSFGCGHGVYSSDLRAIQTQAKRTGLDGKFGNRPQKAETVLECNYSADFGKNLIITPNIQYIINPKGYGTIENAWVLGMEIKLIFF